MHKKPSPNRSLDGFIPQSNAPRRVGFDILKPESKAAKRPENFPGIGQTLSAYKPVGATSIRGAIAEPVQPRLAPSPFDLDIPEETTQKKDKHKGKAKGGRVRRWFRWKRIIAYFFILLLLVGGWLAFKFVYNASKTFNGNVLGILSTTKLKGEDVGRVNILLAGNSSDDPGHDGANLTDSIMIISIDTKDNTAFMLSVPRDLYVDIPDYGHAKINEAYVDGQSENFNQAGYFPGGMGLLQEVIQDNFDLTLNYYSLIDYSALRDMVNAVGGIDVNIQSDDPRGLYDPSVDYVTHGPLVKLTNGEHALTGEQALDLARARGDAYGSYGFEGSDFERTANQRLMLLALKNKVESAKVLANPLTVSKLTDSVGKNVTTNMTLSEARRAYDLGKNINNIQSVGLDSVNGKNYLSSYTTSSGESALIPAAGLDDFSDIETLMKQLTSNNPLTREGASVVVLNGTDTSGLAATAEKKLIDKGLNVVATGDATATQATTTVIDATGDKPSTKQYLASQYGNHVTTTNPYKGIYDADFIVVLGADQVPSTTATPNP